MPKDALVKKAEPLPPPSAAAATSPAAVVDAEKARQFLEKYFNTSPGAPPISIYWGSAADFLRELREQLKTHTANVDEVQSVVDEDEDAWLS